MRRLLIALPLALLLLAPAGARAQTATTASPAVRDAAEALQTDSVYVAPDNNADISQADADRIRAEIRNQGGSGPIYVAVFGPGEGEPAQLGGQLARELQADGVYAIIAGPQGRSFDAGSVRRSGLQTGVAPKLATEAIDAERDNGGAAILLDFVDRVGEARANGGKESSGGGSGVAFIVVIAAFFVLGGGFFLWRSRVRRRQEAEQADELRKIADEDLVALGDDIRALDIDIEMPNIDPRAKEQYARALQAFEQGSSALRQARRPEDFRPIGQTLEEGRYAMEAAKARLEGREPPEHRAPCFFDPRHGPSTRDVAWSPPYGAPRMVPACEADALRVESGDDPRTREIEVAGQGSVPYWQAPAYYGPYAGGFYGGFGGSGLLTGLLAGSLLAGGWDTPAYGAGDWGGGGGDWGGGGDFGGGGDWGGGGFGGGDFGGGGDF
jgi:hypothetical protein